MSFILQFITDISLIFRQIVMKSSLLVSEMINKHKNSTIKPALSPGDRLTWFWDILEVWEEAQDPYESSIDQVPFYYHNVLVVVVGGARDHFGNQSHQAVDPNDGQVSSHEIQSRKNPSEVRVILARHFKNRANDLSYKKYLTLLRLHNHIADDEYFTVARSRTNLIDKEIQQCIAREERLEIEDYFEDSYTQGGKPVPVNENGQPIYKYLDEEECWFSNIGREDILVYSRRFLLSQSILEEAYWPYFYAIKNLVFKSGIEICDLAEKAYLDKCTRQKHAAVEASKSLISILEKDLEDISPGNLQEKENLNNFVYSINGVLNDRPSLIPKYPAIFSELVQGYQKATSHFFKKLGVTSHKEIIALIPKINSFCSILFKYQNQEVLQGEKEIKLGLDDDVDIRKELITMLEELWVKNYIAIDYSRFDFKIYIKPMDWVLDTYAKQQEKDGRYLNENGYYNDSSLQEVLRLVRLTSYADFRKIMKKRSQKIVERLPDKFLDMEAVQNYCQKSDQEINTERLQDLFRMKVSEAGEIFKTTVLKENSSKFLKIIIKNYTITNPVELEVLETLSCIQIRETRTKLMNVLNSVRCYHRSIDIDMRVTHNCQFKFELDDNLLINSNKQLIERFEKNVKDNQTCFSKAQGPTWPTLQAEDFLNHGSLDRTMMYKKDVVAREFYGEDIPHLLVEDGRKRKNNIIYDIALEDLKLVEDRILEIGTHFINRYQRLIKIRSLPQLADRVRILGDLFDLELQFAYAKFNLIEQYYYIYENTCEPLHAHSIATTIIELIYLRPELDLQADYFTQSYKLAINQLKEEAKIISTFSKILEDKEKEHNKEFHRKLTQMCNIPLTMWAYIYGDLEAKSKNTSKLQRMNSVTSKMSKNSKEDRNNLLRDLRNQIKEEFEGNDSGIEEEDEEFNIQEYDQYMLKRNMDDIFEDIVENKNGDKEKQKDPNVAVSSLGLENLIVNPRYEGGPHPELNYLPDLPITSSHHQKLFNFSEHLHWVANIRHLLKQLRQEHKQNYGFCCQEYSSSVYYQICNKVYEILLSPCARVEPFYEFTTDDPYFQTVTKGVRYFEQTMAPILDLPTALQLQLPSTHERHQLLLPNFQALQQFDIHMIKSLVKLERPINLACYRQLNLGINFVQFLRLREKVLHIQLERNQILEAYEFLGKNSETLIEKYAHCYSRSGQSEIFLAASEIKNFSSSFSSYPIFNESIQELRAFCDLELTDIALFRQSVSLFKKEAEDYIRAARDIETENLNKVIDRKKILLSFDKKNVKMIRNRAVGYLATLGTDSLKAHSFNKFKGKLRAMFEQHIRSIKEQDFDQLVISNYLEGNTQKYSQTCKNLLSEKLRKLISLEMMKKYTADLSENLANYRCVIEACDLVEKLRNYVDSLPYLSKIFTIPSEFQHFNKKIFYDQKKFPIVEQDHDGTGRITYICSKEQLIADWQDTRMSPRTNHLSQKIDIEKFVKHTLPPISKDDIFKWMFSIPSNNLQEIGKEAMRHLLKIGNCYTGKISHSEYRKQSIQEPSRNVFWQLKDRYQVLLQYIESNSVLISLQVEDDIFDSLHHLIETHSHFEERYPLVDQAAIYQSDQGEQRIFAPCFIYENKKDELEKQLKIKINSRGYTDKKAHWAVVDQILDFIISKVQGYGVLRHSMLELKDELEALAKLPADVCTKYMRQKTENAYKVLWLALWSTYLGASDPNFSQRFQQISDCFVHVPQTPVCKTPLTINQRRGISKGMLTNPDQIEQEKFRFSLGVYDNSNKFLITQFKPMFSSMPLCLESFIENQIYSLEHGDEQVGAADLQHNWESFQKFRSIFKTLGKQTRFRYFGNCRYIYEQAKKYTTAKMPGNDLRAKFEAQDLKSTYLSYLIESKIQMIGLTELKLSNKGVERNWLNFTKTWEHNREIIDYNTFSVYDQLEAYKEAGKIQFSKTEMLLASNKAQLDKSHQESLNRVIRQIIFCKLAKEEFMSEILEIAIGALKSEKVPKAEGKKIVNSSLIPRVHLIAGYSSPLVIERKTYISQQYKLAFVQAFINRFRNKVSRVDLLSSGYGFVITVPDLEDCVNFMNKLLFTFTEKEFGHRLDTFSQYYQILLEAVSSRNRTIAQQNAIIKALQDKVNNTLEAEYLAKVSKLVHEKVLIEEKLRLAEQASNGLELRVRKTVEHEYQKKLVSIERQNEELRNKFNEFKDLLVKLTKDATKNNFLTLLNLFRDQVSLTLSKKIDLSQSLSEALNLTALNPQQPTKVEYQNTPQDERIETDEEAEVQKEYSQEDIQKCKIGEDIIHDPYYVTKLINKMRLFNLFKLGCRRIKFQDKQNLKDQELTELHQIQDKVVAQTQREAVLREELIRAQEELSKRAIELERARQANEALENEKAKLKILINSRDRKVEQKERELEELKKKYEEGSKIEQTKAAQQESIAKIQEQLPKLSSIRKQKQVSQHKIASRSFITGVEDRSGGGTISLYEKFELSGKDATWRQKCEQLYLENKRLMAELQRQRETIPGVSTPMREGNSLNMRQKRTSDQSERDTSRSDKRKFPNLSFKYSVMRQG